MQSFVFLRMLRIEANDSNCKICFYEKSKLKALILLTIDLDLVNQRDIIEEMSNNIMTLKDENNMLNGQCKALRKYVNQKDAQLKDLNVKILNIQNKFLQVFAKNYSVKLRFNIIFVGYANCRT